MRHNGGATPSRATVAAAPPGPHSTAHAGEGSGVVAWYAESFSDVLGDRLGLFDSSGPSLQLLRFSTTALALPDFEIALRGRLAQVFSFRHPAFALVRGVTVLEDSGQLALVSQQARGERLTTILRAAESRGARLDVDAAIWLLRHVLAALADFHEATGGLAHGWLDTDRVTVAATGEVTITEYVFGAVPAAHAHATPIEDIRDAAWVTLAVLAGRSVAPLNRSDGWAGARAVDAVCGGISPGSVLAPWLKRAFAGGFSSSRAALVALEDLLAGVPGRWRTKLISETPGISETPDVSAPPASTRPAGRGPVRPVIEPELPVTPSTEGSSAPAEPETESSSADVARLTRWNRGLIGVAAVQAAIIAALLLRGPNPAEPLQQTENVPAATTEAAPAAGSAEAPAPSQSALLADAVAAIAAQTPATPAAAPNPVIGWLVVDASVEVKVYANGRLLGTTTRGRFGLPEGQHTVTVVSDAHGYRSSQPIRIVAGRSALIAPRPEPSS